MYSNFKEIKKLTNEYFDGEISAYDSDYLKSKLQQNPNLAKDFVDTNQAIDLFNEYCEEEEIELDVDRLLFDITPRLERNKSDAIIFRLSKAKDIIKKPFNYNTLRYIAAVFFIIIINVVVISVIFEPQVTNNYTTVYKGENIKVSFDPNKYNIKHDIDDEGISVIVGDESPNNKEVSMEEPSKPININVEDFDT